MGFVAAAVAVDLDYTNQRSILRSHEVILPLFPELQSDAVYNLSRIPRSWRIFHILLCFSGVSNVFFITSYPRCMRVASLVYHAAWLCLSIPVVVVYIHSAKWGRSIDNIVKHISMIMHSSYMITLGTTYGINTLKADRTVKFHKK